MFKYLSEIIGSKSNPQVTCKFYGDDGGFSYFLARNGYKGAWCDIINATNKIDNLDSSFRNFLILKVSNGETTSF